MARGRPVTSAEAPVPPPEVEAYLSWLAVEKGRAPRTLEAYRRDLRTYLAFLAERGTSLGAADEDDVVAFLHHRRDIGHAPASVARNLVAVRALHRFLAAESGWDDPTAAVEVPRVPRGLPKALTEDETVALLAVPGGDDPASRRDRAMLELLYGTGMRISELVGLSLGDLDLDDALVRVLGKGSKERVLPLGRYALHELQSWLGPGGRVRCEPRQWASRDDAEAVFLNRAGRRLSRQGAWGIVKKHAGAVGLSAKISPHVLRHSCATHMLDHGADIRTVQELLGHASVSTTQIYTHVLVSQLQSVYRDAHPRARGGPQVAP